MPTPTDQTYKVVVGNRTKVKRVVVGVPITTVVAQGAEGITIDNIAGIDTTGAVNGNLLIYNSVSDAWEANSTLDENQIIDGKFYPSDSAHGLILTRRSGTSGEPPYLRSGEMAYSWLVDPSTDGFGNGGKRLYIGVGADSTYPDATVRAESLEVIGGSYFTNLLNHQAGVNVPNSALIVDSNGRIDSLLVDQLTAINLTSTGITTLDSASIGPLTVRNDASFDSDVTIKGDLIVLGDTTFVLDITLDSTTIDGDLTVNGRTFLNTNGQFYVDSVQIEQYIDSSVNRLLSPGTAINLLYNDSANSLTVSATATDSAVLGVASFNAFADSAQTVKQFTVVNGAVSVNVLDGGFFGNDPLYPG
jgi:uncharacterized protein YaiE (UPF0345 family)|tara:strand:+ start:88 stop:1170 length:1083 start_codon:yes stop_codon:yes gene_type:complete